MSYKDTYRVVFSIIDSRWKVMYQGFAVSDGSTKKEAIQNARLITDEPIYEKDVIIDEA